MSYPDPVYLGEPGLVNARYRPSDHEPELRYRSGGSVHYLATGGSTSGQFGLYRWEMAAAQSGPDPSDFLFVPEGCLHVFKNRSGEPASMLILFAPGAPREDYFETLARVGEGLVMTEEEREAFMVRHDTYWR